MSLDLWNRLAKPPEDALKPIKGGRLSGKTDINPQWRLRAMTEEFGPCGIGWKYTIDKLWTEPGTDGVVFAFALISLYTLADDEWADPIPGIGGHKLIEDETKGLHNNDEAFKMATTDALSVAMKALGVAAEVYLGNFDGSKYRNQPDSPPKKPPPKAGGGVRHPTDKQLKRLFAIGKANGWDEAAIHAYTLREWKVAHTKDLSLGQYKLLCGEADEGIAGVLEGPPPETGGEQERYDAHLKRITEPEEPWTVDTLTTKWAEAEAAYDAKGLNKRALRTTIESAFRKLIDAATDWITFKPAVSKIASGYVANQLDFSAIGAVAAEKMMQLVAAAAEAGDAPSELLAHVNSWAHFSAEQRTQLRNHIEGMETENGQNSDNNPAE